MTSANTPVVTAVETLTVPASRFITSQLGQFARSNTRLYMAIILDVFHSHKGKLPAGYAASLAEIAPDYKDVLPKYCSLVKHAANGRHAATIAAFPATAEGVTDCTKWLENQSAIGGYTLRLQDTKNFLKGERSMRAEAEQKQADADAALARLIAEAEQKADVLTEEQAAKRASDAVPATAEKDARAEGSAKRSIAMQSGLEAELSNAPRNVVSIRDIEPGVPLNDGWDVKMVTIHSKGDAFKVTGLDQLTMADIIALSEQVSALMMASLEAEGKTGTND